jgi:LacI family transcriptional regulator
LKVPSDVSVVSFDDDAIASWTRPSLTTIALPHYDLGRKAVEVLFAEIDRGPTPGDTKAEIHRVPMPLRMRDSVASPAAVTERR